MRIPQARQRPVRSGMTLIELMIALVITGMALAAGYATLSTVIDRRLQANTVGADVVRATTVRRTLIDWLQRGQLQLVVGGVDAPQSFSLETANDELRFVTTASTPLQRDSTVVELYVDTYDAGGLHDTGGPRGLVALLTPTVSALRSMALSSGGVAGGTVPALGSSPPGGTAPFGASTALHDGSGVVSRVVSLDSTVTAMHVDYLVTQPDSTQVWIPSSTWSTMHEVPILAVRLTLQSTPQSALQPMLALPIVVPVWTRL